MTETTGIFCKMLTKILRNQHSQKQYTSNEEELFSSASQQINMQNLGHHIAACFDMSAFKAYVQIQIKEDWRNNWKLICKGTSDKYESNNIHTFWLQGKFNTLWQAYTIKLFPKVLQKTIIGKKSTANGWTYFSHTLIPYKSMDKSTSFLQLQTLSQTTFSVLQMQLHWLCSSYTAPEQSLSLCATGGQISHK